MSTPIREARVGQWIVTVASECSQRYDVAQIDRATKTQIQSGRTRWLRSSGKQTPRYGYSCPVARSAHDTESEARAEVARLEVAQAERARRDRACRAIDVAARKITDPGRAEAAAAIVEHIASAATPDGAITWALAVLRGVLRGATTEEPTP